MSAFAGPEISSDSLVLAFDAGNIKSYDGTENLLTYSEDFSNAVWDKQNASIQSNVITAPDGNTTADKLIEDTTNLVHYTYFTYTFTTSTTYTFSIFAKSGERNFLWITLPNTAFTSNQYRVFNLTTGDGSVGTVSTYSSTRLSNDWWKLTITATATSSSSGQVQVVLRNAQSGASEYQGDGTSGIYIWGAQLEKGSTANPYYPTTTTVKNRGTTWSDLRGTNHVTLSEVSYVNQNIPYFDFNGTSSYAYNLSANSVLNTGNTATVLVWIYPTSTQPNVSYNGMFVLGTKSCALGNGNGQSLLFSMQSNRTLSMAKWCDDGFSSIAPAANTWSMVSLVKNGAATRFGINASIFENTSDTGTQNFSGNSLTVGCTDNPGRFYQGRIGAVYLFNKALTDSEIQQNFNALRGRYGI